MNNIDKIITLSNNSKYMVMDQGNYKNKMYYLTSKLDENGNLTNDFNILEDNNGIVNAVSDADTLNILVNYFKKRMEVRV